MKKLLFLLIGSMTLFSAFAVEAGAEGYDIQLKIDGLSCDEELILANHYGDKQYSRDTSECINGVFHFSGATSLESGIYLVVLPGRNYFEIVLSADEDQHKYYFETDTTLDQTKMVTKGSRENEVFFAFNKFISAKAKEIKVLQDAYTAAPEGEAKDNLKTQIIEVQRSMTDRRKMLGDDNPELFIGKVYKSMQDVVVPDPPADMADSLKRIYGYMYYRTHFWDNVDLGENGMVRTPFFHKKLVDYFDKYVPPVPDTAIMLTDQLLNEMDARGSTEQFKYTIHFLLGYFQKSRHMCFDKALHHITKNYYCNGRAFWADSAFQQEMCEQTAKMAPTLCELPAPDLNMPDSSFRMRHRLSEIESPVTILIFWDINCGHCKKEMPIIKAFWDSCNREEVAIYAVYTQGDWEGWKKFIREKNLNFLNVANAFGEDDFRKDYNIVSTPQIYVLDKEKKIKFKKIGAADIRGIVDFLLIEQQSNP